AVAADNRDSSHGRILGRRNRSSGREGLGVADEHATRLRAFVRRDDPAALEHVDQAAGARVADAQATLKERDGGRLRLDDDLDRLLEQWILVRVEVAVEVFVAIRRLALGRLEHRLVELLLPLRAALVDE